MKSQTLQRQKGAYLALMGALMVPLIGAGAFAVDFGRLYVMRSEMQNAADAAAIAAAMELDNRPNARARAENAARNLLQHDSKFADVANLLGGNIRLEFFCAIGAQYDPGPKEIKHFCVNDYVNGRSVATSDVETSYVRVILETTDANGAYSLPLLFLPALSDVADQVDPRASLSASATGGRNVYMCDFPPTMLCNPFESSGMAFQDEMKPGDQIILKQQGANQWAPGNFGFLQPDNTSGGGAPETSQFLADENLSGCKAPLFTTATGSMTNMTSNALNTRFDIYNNPGYGRADAPDNWPPAPNVINFPRDASWRVIDDRFGQGDWNRDSYFATYHDWQMHGRPGGWADMTRWETYNWAITENKLPSQAPLLATTNDSSYDGIPDPDHLYTGQYPPQSSSPERRVFMVAVANCVAHGISGQTTFPLIDPTEGFAKLFMTEHVMPPPAADILVEYMSWADAESSEDIHVDVQLYD